MRKKKWAQEPFLSKSQADGDTHGLKFMTVMTSRKVFGPMSKMFDLKF